MKLNILITLVALISFFSAEAQSRIENRGDKAYDAYAFINARDYYLKVAEKEGEDASDELLEKLADSYYYTADYKTASYWYQKRYMKDSPIKAEYLYRFALSLKSTGNYDFSDKVMQQFYEAEGDDFRAKLFNQNRDYLKEIELQSGKFNISKASFNSPLSDFAPSFYKNGILFASNRERLQASKNIHQWNEQPFLDLYFISVDSTSKVKSFSNKINTKYHESTAVATKDGNTIYFTRNNYVNHSYREDSKGVNRLKLFKATKVNDAWEVSALPFNSDEYSVAHPALSSDESTLYFSSDMPGGFGQSDLYKVEIQENGFGKPKNLGKQINTEGRETFPFIDADNKLFFASDGHIGLGGLDVFVAQITSDGGVGPSFNIGKPINGSSDDFTFIIDSATKKGYVASNRDGDAGNDDIYEIEETSPLFTSCFQLLKGVVLDADTQMPLADASVSLLDGNQQLIAQVYTDVEGRFSYENYLGCMQNYALRAEKTHYTKEEKVIATGNLPTETIETTILLKKGDFVMGTDLGKVLKLNPIYFDFDKSNIRPDAEIELQKVIDAMQTFPQLKIDVRSHTDSRAPADYNLSLSERRNKATIQYIIEKGNIDPSRLSGRGYGEESLVNHCSDGVPCSIEEHQLNRRSEFIILNK
ncbi:OmpA family protein [Joostella sp. CR20]|uniref:OmpA family protein n=1 Tax=Joostella sp. CR20 TaxID=2804312 RepID=UPI00313BC847